MASVAIGDVAAESMNLVEGEPGFVAGKGAEVVAGVSFPLAVARVVVMVTGRGSRMREGKKSWAGKRASCGVVSFVQRCTFRSTVSKRSCLSRGKDHSVLEIKPRYKSTCWVRGGKTVCIGVRAWVQKHTLSFTEEKSTMYFWPYVGPSAKTWARG